MCDVVSSMMNLIGPAQVSREVFSKESESLSHASSLSLVARRSLPLAWGPNPKV